MGCLVLRRSNVGRKTKEKRVRKKKKERKIPSTIAVSFRGARSPVNSVFVGVVIFSRDAFLPSFIEFFFLDVPFSVESSSPAAALDFFDSWLQLGNN